MAQQQLIRQGKAGAELEGPAILKQLTATTLLLPGVKGERP